MFRPKRTIPKLAVATLALTGCGSDSPSALGESINAFCMNVVGCFPDYTLGDCTAYYSDLLGNYNLSSTCQAALATYFNCGAALSCEELELYNNSCDDEFDAIYNGCISN